MIASRKGLEGRLILKHDEAFSSAICEGMEFHLVPPRIDVPREVTVDSVSYLSETETVVFLCGIDDATTSEEVVGMHCLVDAGKYGLEDLVGESSEFDIIGYKLRDVTFGEVGTIVRIDERPHQSLLYVDASNGSGEDIELMVPLAEELIEDIDDASCEILMDCPDGLLEMQGFRHAN